MKKTLLILAMASLVVACKPKDKNDPQPNLIISKMNVRIDNYIDTIRPNTNAQFGLIIDLNNSEGNNITNIPVKVSFRFLDNKGVIKKNGEVFTSGNLFSSTYNIFSYEPSTSVSNYKERLEITSVVNNLTIKDTIEYYIKSYNPSPYKIIIPINDFASSINSTFKFNINLSNADNTYSLLIKELILPQNPYGTITLNYINTNTPVFVNVKKSIDVNNEFKVSVGNVQQGNYKIPFQIIDKNGDFKNDTIRFTIK